MLIGLVAFIIFLFVVFVLTKEDFVFLRRNVLQDEIFDTIFLGSLIFLLAGRVTFVLFHLSTHYLNPLVFFLLPYFPGITIEGGVIGAVIFLYVFTRNKKMPIFRLSDVLSLSYLLGCASYFLISGIWDLRSHISVGILSISIAFLYTICFILIRKLFADVHWEDGVVTGGALVIDSLLRFLYLFIIMALSKKIMFFPEIILGIIIFLFGCSLFIIKRGGFFTAKKYHDR